MQRAHTRCHLVWISLNLAYGAMYRARAQDALQEMEGKISNT